MSMYSRGYKTAVSVPPLLWVSVLLFVPYLILLCYSFWRVKSGQTIVHTWDFENYRQLLENPMYLSVLLRSMKIAGSVTALSLALGYPLAYFLSFHATVRK